jgi:hypothetical protein
VSGTVPFPGQDDQSWTDWGQWVHDQVSTGSGTQLSVDGVPVETYDIDTTPVTPADIGAATAGHTHSGSSTVGARIYKNGSNQTITANGGIDEITLGSTAWSGGGCVVSSTGITVPEAGLYLISSEVGISGGAAGPRQAIVRVNYVQQIETSMPYSSTGDTLIQASAPIPLAANDFVHLWTYIGTDNSTALAISGARFTWLSVVRLGPAPS